MSLPPRARTASYFSDQQIPPCGLLRTETCESYAEKLDDSASWQWNGSKRQWTASSVAVLLNSAVMLSDVKRRCSLYRIASDLDPIVFAQLRMTVHRGSQEIVRRYRSGEA